MPFLVTGCASKTAPDVNVMRKLDLDEIKSLLIGNTLTYQAVWGRWAEFYREDGTGHIGTWPDLLDIYGWEGDEASLSYELTDNAEICRQYSGDPDWANPEFTYCSLIYTIDTDYYIVDTKNPYNPKFIGVPHALQIKRADYYDLLYGLDNQGLRREK